MRIVQRTLIARRDRATPDQVVMQQDFLTELQSASTGTGGAGRRDRG